MRQHSPTLSADSPAAPRIGHKREHYVRLQRNARPEANNWHARRTVRHCRDGGARLRTRQNAGRRRYSTSKLCNVYCAYEYARRLAGSSDARLQSLRVNAFDPGFMPATDLARTYSAPLRLISRYILPALSLFMSNVHSPVTSGRRLALALGGEGPVTGTLRWE